MNDSTTKSEVQRMECPASKDPAVRLFILAAMLLGFSIYAIYDHYIMGKYPYPEPYALNPYLNYLFNHYIPYVLIPPGLVALVLGVVFLRRVLVADEQGIGYKGKTRIAWNDIESLDTSRISKGLLYLCYSDGQKKMTLDSWKLKNFRDLVLFIEKRLPGKTSHE